MKILNIQDTRTYEEGPNDKWIPIPGSGIENECARCLKFHEVHVTIQSEERVFIVGTGCAKKENMISDKQARVGNSTAKTIAKWQAQIIELTPLAKEWNQIYKEELHNWLSNDKQTGNRFIVDKKSRERMGIPQNEYDEDLQIIKSYPNPSYRLEKAQKSLIRAEKKMTKLING